MFPMVPGAAGKRSCLCGRFFGRGDDLRLGSIDGFGQRPEKAATQTAFCCLFIGSGAIAASM
jgi:hypothetical protein